MFGGQRALTRGSGAALVDAVFVQAYYAEASYAEAIHVVQCAWL